MLQLLLTGFTSWLRRPSTWIPLLLAGLIIASSQAVTTCHTRPAGMLTKREQRQQQAQQDKALAAAAAYHQRATSAEHAASTLRAAARAYDDSATYYARHAHPVSTPAADSSGLAQFWATLFGR
ncbi:hypothetical protein HHL22_20500 [Hymenobacter sp. RP-2-7]|uniref:Uncharacterized protein n=1 Tax=Hymenobacter polaris TaxID=2682546 RepID=A0A7Y0FP35_9BACT|nr:hypothetical protein [Hymenobacter polaris]NML67588.1 hypothetical protein [Hymenobacter polaris]